MLKVVLSAVPLTSMEKKLRNMSALIASNMTFLSFYKSRNFVEKPTFEGFLEPSKLGGQRA